MGRVGDAAAAAYEGLLAKFLGGVLSVVGVVVVVDGVLMEVGMEVEDVDAWVG